MAIDIQDPISWQTVEDAIYDWVTRVTEVNAQWADQADPQTDLPFCLLSIDGPTEIGSGDEKRVAEKLGSTGLPTGLYEMEHRGQREITVEVQINAGPPNNEDPSCYSRALGTRLQSSLNMEAFWRPLDNAGLAYIAYNPLLDASLNVADLYVDRKILEVRFTLASSVTEDIEIIERATINGELNRPDGSVMDVGPIDVDANPGS